MSEGAGGQSEKTDHGKRVFISYSHDSDAHKAWVRGLGEYLVTNGIEVVLDQWELRLGDDLPAFMENAIRKTDRIIAICTDVYVQKANSGSGGVGYEKTIATAEITRDQRSRRRFIPVIRNAVGEEKLPAFFGAAYYLDLSDGKDSEDARKELVKEIYDVQPSKPALGASPFIPAQAPQSAQANDPDKKPSFGRPSIVEFSRRFGQAFPGLRGIGWFDDPDVIAQRLGILLQNPLVGIEGPLAGWWRGPQNLQIESFEHIEGRHFLMDADELNIRRIAAYNPNIYDRCFVYVETSADPPTGLYPSTEDDIKSEVEAFGYAREEYGLVDGKLPVTRKEYDDGAALIDGKPVDIRGRVALRERHISAYNFLVAPYLSPVSNSSFDEALREYLDRLLHGEDIFAELCEATKKLPKRH